MAALDESAMTGPQKEQLEKYVIKGYNIIYDEGGAIVDMASKNDNTKIESVANAGFIVGKKIDMSEEQEGNPPVPDNIKAVGGYHLIEKIIQYAEHKGVKPFTEEEKMAALKSAYQKYIEDGIKNRTIDPMALAQSTEKMQPGSVKQALAGVPDTAPQGGAMPPPVPQGGAMPPPVPQGGAIPPPAPQGGAMTPPKQGLLSKPSPLEGILNG